MKEKVKGKPCGVKAAGGSGSQFECSGSFVNPRLCEVPARGAPASPHLPEALASVSCHACVTLEFSQPSVTGLSGFTAVEFDKWGLWRPGRVLYGILMGKGTQWSPSLGR